jgi:phosphatidylserine decarboxylase
VDREKRLRESRIAREGMKLILPSLVLFALLFIVHAYILSSIVFLFLIFCLFFFRNPRRISAEPDNVLLSPADGKVMEVGQIAENEFINVTMQRISIFMSPADVHVNRAPCEGQVVKMLHRPGEFALAFRKDIDKNNERNYILIEHHNERLLLVQIAGFLARRIIAYVKEGDHVSRGDTVGMIAFGSRVDIYFPNNYETMVELHQKVKAGITPLAQRKGEI